MRAMADHGDGAVAGLGVVMRLTILSFGGIFALSGAIGGIIGQNAGAGLKDRVASAYLDSLKFCVFYTVVVWGTLGLFADTVASAFGLSGEGAEVVRVFSFYAAGSFLFTGALFVANSAFNNLGKPVWATLANWLRDGALMGPLAMLMGGLFGVGGVVMAQALANVIAGLGAGWLGWRYVRAGHGIEPRGGAKQAGKVA